MSGVAGDYLDDPQLPRSSISGAVTVMARVFRRAIVIAISLSYFTANVDAEVPSKAYSGWLTPSNYFGVFTLNANAQDSETSNQSDVIDRSVSYFRLRGVETNKAALEKFAYGKKFYCEDRGNVFSPIFGNLVIVDCRGEKIPSLGRLLLDENVAKPICAEMLLRSQACKN